MESKFSPLEALPEELIWSIMDYIPEAVLAMRSASTTLRDHIDRYASQIGSILLVDRLLVSGFNEESDQIGVSVFIPVGKSELFDLRLRQIPKGNGLDCVKVEQRTRVIVDYFDYINYRFTFDSSDTEESKLLCLGACMGKPPKTSPTNHGKIGYVELIECHDDRKRKYVSILLDGFTFGRLYFSVNQLMDCHVDYLREACRLYNVEKLELDIVYNSVSDTAKLLRDLSLIISSLYIRNQGVTMNAHPYNMVNDFLRDDNADWAAIIIEMFCGKMDKLCIDPNFSRYLTDQNIADLSKRLPELGKEVWFCAPCVRRCPYSAGAQESQGIYNDHYIQKTMKALSIKHYSRQYEPAEY